MAQPVVHFEIGANNPEKARDFYVKLFGWETEAPPGMNYNLVKAAGEGSIGGGIGGLPPGGSPYATIYVQVDDLQSYLDRAGSLGGKTLVPPTPIPGVGSFAWFADPEGVAIGLFRHGE